MVAPRLPPSTPAQAVFRGRNTCEAFGTRISACISQTRTWRSFFENTNDMENLIIFVSAEIWRRPRSVDGGGRFATGLTLCDMDVGINDHTSLNAVGSVSHCQTCTSRTGQIREGALSFIRQQNGVEAIRARGPLFYWNVRCLFDVPKKMIRV